MFSADPACEIGFVEQLEKDAEGAERGKEERRENCFTTKTQRTRSFGLGKFLFPELRALCVSVVKQFLRALLFPSATSQFRLDYLYGLL